MKNKGQATIFLVILIPIIILVLAFIFDTGLMLVQRTRFNSTTRVIMKDILTNSYTDYEKNIEDMYIKNKYQVDFLDVKYEEGKLTIYNSYSYDSFLGRIIGIKKYRVEVNLSAEVINDKVIIEEVKNE